MVNREYSKHPYYSCFNNMVRRAKMLGVGCDYTRCLESFNQWLKDIGPMPSDMEVPTIGRIDHDKGYVFDKDNNRLNFGWQSQEENSREVFLRLFTPEMRSEAANIGRRKTVELGKAGFQTATSEQQTERSRKAVESPNHPSKQTRVCKYCGREIKGQAGFSVHIKTHKDIHMIEDMKPIEFPQMMLSFGA
jgi:hypothetical protein